MADEIWDYYAKDLSGELDKTTQMLVVTRNELEQAKENFILTINKWKDIAKSLYDAIQIQDEEKIALSVAAYETALKDTNSHAK